MARKRSSLTENPPAASEDVSVSSGEEGEQPQKPVVEASSDSEPEDFVVKPTEDKRNKSRAKRPAASEPAKASKRAKKNSSVAATPQKTEKKMFHRVWSENDEIAILNGLAEYKARTGSSSLADMDAFYDIVQTLLPRMEFSKSQLSDKVKRLKRRYHNRKKKTTYEPSEPIEKEAYELSSKIWSANISRDEPIWNAAAVKKIPHSLKPMEQVGSGNLAARIANVLPESAVKRGLALVSGEKKADLEAKWREIDTAELVLFVKKTQVISEHVSLVHKALRSSSSES